MSSGALTQAEAATVVAPIATRLTAQHPTASTVTVHGISPTIWSSKAAVETNIKRLFTVSGAFGLNLAPGKDAAKVVSESDACNGGAPSGGTNEITDIGPGDTSGAQTAQLDFTFTASGAYKLCYRLFGKTYRMVGTHLVQVYDAGPVIQGYSPAQGASAVAPQSNIVISFDTQIQLGSAGFVNLSTPATAQPTLIPVPDAQVSVTGNTITINPYSNLNTQGATYTVNIDAGVVTDGTHVFQGLNGSTYQFTVVSQLHAMFTLTGSIEDFGNVYPGVVGTGRYSPLVLYLASAVSLGPSNVTMAMVKSGSIIAIATFSIDHTKSVHGLTSVNASLHSLKGKSIAGFPVLGVITGPDLSVFTGRLPSPPPPLPQNNTKIAERIAVAES